MKTKIRQGRMPRLTKEQANRLIDRAKHNFQDPDERESVLQGKITQWAKVHGYPCLSFRQSKKAQGFLLPGYPDITLMIEFNISCNIIII